ncbi:uncharacterized protein LOC111392753 [Olea europaea var. sylvestris]|uniref:uncharacterized protein LOC111392753 n=1 Tax=Olea europaea var. sylvestris TaxID=158386 RepID=UPI000C1CF198|nr:uncharacterized protein LOC111392753 [Olea europaea var. sylvestris]
MVEKGYTEPTSKADEDVLNAAKKAALKEARKKDQRALYREDNENLPIDVEKEFETLEMLDSESILEYFTRVLTRVNNIKRNGEKIQDLQRSMNNGSIKKLHQNLLIKHCNQSFLFKKIKEMKEIHDQVEEGANFKEDEVLIIEEEEEDLTSMVDMKFNNNFIREEEDNIEVEVEDKKDAEMVLIIKLVTKGMSSYNCHKYRHYSNKCHAKIAEVEVRKYQLW